MTTAMHGIKVFENEQGILTAEFIFSMVLAAVMITVLLSMTATLSAIEIAQYIAFSTARTYAVAHEDESHQNLLAQDKFKALLNHPEIAPLLSKDDGGGFFSLSNPEIRGEHANSSNPNFNDQYAQDAPQRMSHTGVRLLFTANVLKRKVPFLGSTISGDDDNLSTYITSFIFREPNRDECLSAMQEIRYQAIMRLDSGNRFSEWAGKDTAYRERLPTMEDNGC